MPLDTAMVGASTEPVTHNVDARWTMSYAAALADHNPRYFDTHGQTVVAHPVFPVCLEWPVILGSRRLPGGDAMTPTQAARTVHASHDLHLYRPIRAGDRLTTRATVVGLQRIKPGAAQMLRLDTVDAGGELVCRTYQLSISRDVDVTGEPAPAKELPELPKPSAAVSTQLAFPIPVAAGSAHIYSECARIWNPIHTDRAVALAAGLPDIILHGTASLALAVTRLVDEYLGADPTRVRRLGGRFSAMVLMPSTLTLQIVGPERNTLFFTLQTATGQSALSQGFLVYG